MSSNRNLALLAGGAVALAVVAFLGGRRVEAESKGGQSSPISTALVPAHPSLALSATAAAPPTSAPKPAASGANPMTDPDGLKDLFARLQAEREHRPKLEPMAETVFEAAKKKAGVQVEEQLQVAGWIVGAKFCDKIRSTKDVHIVVCEFANEEEAIAGQKAATNGIKRREVLRNKATTCAVHQAGESPEAVAQTAKVKELFKAM